jgi:hypothetical protein
LARSRYHVYYAQLDDGASALDSVRLKRVGLDSRSILHRPKRPGEPRDYILGRVTVRWGPLSAQRRF